MNKFNFKLFFKLFFLLLIIQLTVGLLGAFLEFSNSNLSTITSMLLTIFSLPINFISSDLPFYAREGTTASILYWILNLFIQTVILYSGLALIRQQKKTL